MAAVDGAGGAPREWGIRAGGAQGMTPIESPFFFNHQCPFFTSTKNWFLAHFFSNSYSKTDKDFSMKPTPNSHKYPKFSVKKAEKIYLNLF